MTLPRHDGPATGTRGPVDPPLSAELRRRFFLLDWPRVALAVAGEALDLGTWLYFRPRELNPVVVALGDAAAAVKVAVVLAIIAIAAAIGPPWCRRVLLLACAVGLIGAVSNLPISLRMY